MEDWQRNFIRKNIVELTKNTICNVSLLQHLHSKGILSQDDIDYFNTFKQPLEKASAFYTRIQTRENAYGFLLAALLEENQTGAAKIFFEGYVKTSPCFSVQQQNFEGSHEQTQAGSLTSLPSKQPDTKIFFQNPERKFFIKTSNDGISTIFQKDGGKHQLNVGQDVFILCTVVNQDCQGEVSDSKETYISSQVLMILDNINPNIKRKKLKMWFWGGFILVLVGVCVGGFSLAFLCGKSCIIGYVIAFGILSIGVAILISICAICLF